MGAAEHGVTVLSGAIDEFLRGMETTRGASPHTLRAYGRDLAELDEFLVELELAGPTDVTPRTLRRFLARLDRFIREQVAEFRV